jgi:inhibitor of KinA sporulation pathway (predicted exonuclease)
MSLDCEYNQPSRKTIQIGAAIFNAKTGIEIDRILLYINPNEPIHPEIIELTGINDKDAQNGTTIQEAYEELNRFHAKHKCFRNPLVWGSGSWNDSDHIYQEYRNSLGSGTGDSFRDAENFMGLRVLDVKTIYQSIQIYRNSRHGGGLKESMTKLKLDFEGQEHTALADARNTFKMWFHLVKIFENGRVD